MKLGEYQRHEYFKDRAGEIITTINKNYSNLNIKFLDGKTIKINNKKSRDIFRLIGDKSSFEIHPSGDPKSVFIRAKTKKYGWNQNEKNINQILESCHNLSKELKKILE